MQLGAFVARIHETRGVAIAALRDELVAASVRAAAGVLGPQPRIEAVWNEEQGTVELRQVLTAVERVTHPHRELAVTSLRTLGGDFVAIATGEEMELSLLHRDADAAQAAELDAMFGGLLTLSCFQRSLDAPLEEAWTAVIQRHLPPREWPDGTVASLFQRGGWLAGTRASRDGITLTIARGGWKERPLTPDDASIAYGITLAIERRGHALELPLDARAGLAEVATWAAAPAPESRRAAVEGELAAAAQALAHESSIGRLQETDLLRRILAAIRSAV